MQEKAKEPEIRFAGFTGAWEQRKIKDLAANTYGGGTPSTSNPDFWEGSIPWIQSSDLSEHNLFRVRPRKFISQAAVTNSPVKIIPESSIAVITRVGVGKLAVMNFSYTTSQDFLSLSNLNTDVKFTSYQLYRRLQKDLNAVQGTSIKGITKEELLGKNIFIPGRQEQEAIGKFFSKIDSLLTLHQRKYEKLLNIKKSMLEKMFPKEGEVVPEIRFKGFTGAWEQRKLSDIAERITRKNTHLESTLPLTISSSYGLIDQYAYFNNRVASRNTRNYYLIKNGEFAYNKSYSDGFPFGSVKRLDRYAMGVLSTLYIIFSIDYRKVNSDFLVSYYDTKNWHHQVALRAAEGARNHGLLNISADDFFETELKIPMDLDEQKKIGSFFVQLNSFITLHQRKLEMLKNVKQAFLEKMFV